MGWVGGGGGGGNFSHAINQLTHDFSCNMRFIFLDFYFPFYLALPLRGRANKRKIKISKNKSHIALEIMR